MSRYGALLHPSAGSGPSGSQGDTNSGGGSGAINHAWNGSSLGVDTALHTDVAIVFDRKYREHSG